MEANRKLGRAGEAFLHTEGQLLAVGVLRLADKLGVTIGGDVEYVVYGMPLDCEMALSARDHIEADPACVAVDGDNIQ